MKLVRYEFILRAMQPINHQAETIGNEGVIMRESIRLPGGDYAMVPHITGDTCRSGIRRAAAWATLDAAGMLEDPKFSEAALRLLFSGGKVTKKGSAGAINLDIYRRLTDLVPSLKLLGGCSDSRIIPGTTNVDSAILLCRETEHLVREYTPQVGEDGQVTSWVIEWLAANGERLNPARMGVDEVQRVRMDPTIVPEMRQFLSGDAHVEVNRRLSASEAAHTDDDAVGQEEEKSSMMPRRFEVVKRGELFFWGVEARCYSPLDEDTLNVAVAVWLADARVGGKKGSGHGLIRPVVAKNIEAVRLSRKTSALALHGGVEIGKVFREHVGARRDAIREMFATVDA